MQSSPSPQVLRALVRRVMSKGVPEADAEDVVSRAWVKTRAAFREERGSFEVLWKRVADREAIDWWRRQRPRVPPDGLPARRDSAARPRAEANQRALLEQLSEQERRVFAVWALQRHLPQGQLTAPRAAARLDMSTTEFNNAKRRLRDRVRRLASELGLSARDLYTLDDDEGPRRSRVG